MYKNVLDMRKSRGRDQFGVEEEGWESHDSIMLEHVVVACHVRDWAGGKLGRVGEVGRAKIV